MPDAANNFSTEILRDAFAVSEMLDPLSLSLNLAHSISSINFASAIAQSLLITCNLQHLLQIGRRPLLIKVFLKDVISSEFQSP